VESAIKMRGIGDMAAVVRSLFEIKKGGFNLGGTNQIRKSDLLNWEKFERRLALIP